MTRAPATSSTPPGCDDERLDALNRELLYRIHEGGVAVPSYSTLNGRYCLRVAISNHRSMTEDFDLFVDELLLQARDLAGSGS